MEINEGILKHILNQAAKSIVGKVCKRFEVNPKSDKEEIKLQIKELLYEHNRDLFNQIINMTKKEIYLINQDEVRKEEKENQNGR